MGSAVKSLRPSRAQRARSTRRRVLDRAGERFVAQGYAATTMEQIAADAGVAVQTVYYAFRTKGNLLRELVERTAAGVDQPVPVIERPWMTEVLASPSGERALALAVTHGTAIYDRVAHLWPAVAAASGVDPEVDTWWSGVSGARRAGQGRLVARLAELGRLPATLPQDRAGDLLFVLMGHDVYRSLVVDARWPIADYRAWLYRTLVEQLLTPAGDRDQG